MLNDYGRDAHLRTASYFGVIFARHLPGFMLLQQVAPVQDEQASVFAGIGGMVPARVSCEFWQFWNQISGTQGLGCGMITIY